MLLLIPVLLFNNTNLYGKYSFCYMNQLSYLFMNDKMIMSLEKRKQT